MRGKRGSLLILFLILLITISSLSLAQEDDKYHLKLLAVQETPEGHQGSDADITLELKEGSGRVFLDTFPVTRMDTQISTRFAKEIACKHFNLNCNVYDFIYTIEAKSNIIGGPSAGAAIAALTTIALLDLNYDDDTTITGTINSGGIIGPVGGVKEKLEAASKAGIKKVLISKGTAAQLSYSAENISQDNATTNNSVIKNNQTTNINKITETNKSTNITSPTNITPVTNKPAFSLLNYSKENFKKVIIQLTSHWFYFWR